MIERGLFLLLVLGLALIVVWFRERSHPRTRLVPPGITVLTGPDCRLCGPLLRALDELGADYRLLDVTRDPLPLAVNSLPTVLVGDGLGALALRRTGRAAISDLSTILAVAAAGGSVKEIA